MEGDRSVGGRMEGRQSRREVGIKEGRKDRKNGGIMQHERSHNRRKKGKIKRTVG